MPGTLHLVSAPLGDPDDLSVRALRVLGSVAVVAAEDTRTARALLAHHRIRARLVSYHDHNEAERTPTLLRRLIAGDDVALLPEAGTPLVSDPGWTIVLACIAAGIPIDVVPGPSAVIAALTGAGLPVDRFVFAGFLPRTAGARRSTLVELGAVAATLVFFESPRRLGATLGDVAELWPSRRVCVARNLTKIHEQWLRGTAGEVRSALGDETRGELVVLLDRQEAQPVAGVDDTIDALAALPTRAAADQVAARHGLPRRDAYARVLARRR